MKKTWMVLVAAFVLAAALWSAPAQSVAADKIVLGMPVRPPVMVHLPVFYALDNDIFKKHGLDVEIKFFRGGVATHRAITSKKSGLDAAWVPAPIAMVGITKGSGMKFFHSMAYLNEAQMAANDQVKKPADLKGKTIGIEGRGGYSHLGALAVLATAGLTDKDVKYIKTPPPARVPFLLKGKADAVVIHVEQVLVVKKRKPSFNKLMDLWKAMPNFFYGAFIAPSSKINSNKDAYVRFAMAMMQSNRSIYKDKAGYLKSANKWVRPVYKKNPEIMSKTYDVFVAEKIWGVNNGIPKASVSFTADYMKRLGKIKGKVPSYEDIVDTSVTKAALAKAGKI